MTQWSTQTKVGWIVAVAWAALLPVLALVVPVGTEITSGSDGVETTRHLTLAQAEGISGVLTVAVPLLLVLLAGGAMAARASWGLPVGWTLFGLLAAANLLALMSVGIAVIPVTVALLVALVGRSSPTRRGAPAPGTRA
ncbi:hypothetical protein [Demequina phytophila]|uniref:hypothetical protein n=1 Tax=Demequina phytophila TaxID=1638981 RepID=UPI000782C2DF|nr:hypothetical protein [Demequina phytophila]